MAAPLVLPPAARHLSALALLLVLASCREGVAPRTVATDTVTLTPAPRPGTLSAGDQFTCGITSAGVGYCWGTGIANGSGLASSPVPVPIAGGLAFARIAVEGGRGVGMGTRACALTTDGAAYCSLLGSGSNGAVPLAGGHVFVDLAFGFGDYACGITREGEAYCWGEDDLGELGDGGGGGYQTAPVRIPGSDYVAVTAGEGHACALTAAGAAYCWGVVGLLGNGQPIQLPPFTLSPPVAVSGGLRFARISAGVDHTCALTLTGDAYCWGGGLGSQLGNRSTSDSYVPVRVTAAGGPFVDITAAAWYTCALTVAGAAFCWGYNWMAQLGNGSVSVNPVATASAVAGGVRFRFLAAGATHACGVGADGSAYCWGSRGQGELGNDAPNYRRLPSAVAGALTLRSISAGGEHTCAVASDGRAYCWGSNCAVYRGCWPGDQASGAQGGILGTGSTSGPTTCEWLSPCAWQPVRVAAPEALQSVASGYAHACAVAGSGHVYCWGAGSAGQLGNGLTSLASRPQLLVAPAITAVAAGDAHTCALAADSTAVCWGSNVAGQLGIGAATNGSTTPVPISGGLRFRALAAGGMQTCALTSAGELYCWGSDQLGQLAGASLDHCVIPADAEGSAYTIPCSLAPRRVAAPTTFRSVALGSRHTCAVASDGAALCWGASSAGQLGAPSSDQCQDRYSWKYGPVPCSRTPLQVVGAPPLATVSAGYQHSCGLTSAGALYCWGTLPSLGPAAVLLAAPSLATLTSGSSHACGLTAAGTAYCWGDSDMGQTGDMAPYQTAPAPVSGGLRFWQDTAAAAALAGRAAQTARR